MKKIKSMPTPEELKEKIKLSNNAKLVKEKRDKELKDILSGKEDKFILIIGPCSADCEDSVMEYVHRLKKVEEKVNDKIFIIPRVYTNKPRTTGLGYKGMLHQPDLMKSENMKEGLIAIRNIHKRVLEETGLTTADEMLYPENHEYLSDILGYVAVGARSVENQLHRMVSSGVDMPVGMKNPTSGDIKVMINSIIAAQNKHTFIYRNYEVKTEGNLFAHAILRGYQNKHGESRSNYHYENLIELNKLYKESGLINPSLIIDCNHSNSGKKYLEQIRIAKEVMETRNESENVKKLVKGLMIESYIEDGNCKIDEHVFGKSITDPCLGMEKTEKLILDIAKML